MRSIPGGGTLQMRIYHRHRQGPGPGESRALGGLAEDGAFALLAPLAPLGQNVIPALNVIPAPNGNGIPALALLLNNIKG